MNHVRPFTYVGIACAIALPAIAVAALDIPNAFVDGTAISADEMNANFDAVKAKVEELEALPHAPAYCGNTSLSTTGAIGNAGAGNGYREAALACEQACGAGAVMCTGADLVRHVSAGGAIADTPWYASGYATSGNDCDGFKSGSSGLTGPYWLGSTNQPSTAGCDISHPIACCL